MAVDRVGEAEQLLQIHLPGSGGQQIHTPDNFRHTGLTVIHGDCQLVDIDTVCPADHHIATVCVKIQTIVALNQVGDGPGLVRHDHPPGGAAVERCPLIFRQIPAGTGVDVGTVG